MCTFMRSKRQWCQRVAMAPKGSTEVGLQGVPRALPSGPTIVGFTFKTGQSLFIPCSTIFIKGIFFTPYPILWLGARRTNRYVHLPLACHSHSCDTHTSRTPWRYTPTWCTFRLLIRVSSKAHVRIGTIFLSRFFWVFRLAVTDFISVLDLELSKGTV